jgi:hypothetical protein
MPPGQGWHQSVLADFEFHAGAFTPHPPAHASPKNAGKTNLIEIVIPA